MSEKNFGAPPPMPASAPVESSGLEDSWENSHENLIETEKQKLSEFFGKPIDVPALPAEITPERAAEWKKLGFELHYLPAEEMTKEKEFPGWKMKPPDWFFESDNVALDIVDLPGGWALIDGRPKPNNQGGRQRYDHDPLAKVLPNKTRFGLSWNDIHEPEMRKAIADILKVDSERLALPQAIEWNVLGNIHHPEWGETDTWEWFEDSYSGARRLAGGQAKQGGLSHLDRGKARAQRDFVGFRPLVRFPSK